MPGCMDTCTRPLMWGSLSYCEEAVSTIIAFQGFRVIISSDVGRIGSGVCCLPIVWTLHSGTDVEGLSSTPNPWDNQFPKDSGNGFGDDFISLDIPGLYTCNQPTRRP